jgi:hypothetical protein
MKTKTIEIVKDNQNPESDKILAKAILELSEGVNRLLAGPLRFETIVLLLKEKSGVPLYQVREVLAALPRLKEFLK